jgi:hypothetical protein
MRMQRPNRDAREIMSWVFSAVFIGMATSLFGWKGAILAVSGYLTLLYVVGVLEADLNRKLEAIREVLADLRYQTRNLGDGR